MELTEFFGNVEGYHADMDFLAMPEAGLAGLFLSSLLSATLLPGGSELVLLAFLAAHPGQLVPAMVLASIGNTAGGMITYGMARWLPQHLEPQKSTLVRRWGSPALLLAWTPLIGDLLCVAAGWLRLGWLPCLLWMALGKTARYVAVVALSGMM
jgi:membrane protein YqaA with SNARE-associated domain